MYTEFYHLNRWIAFLFLLIIGIGDLAAEPLHIYGVEFSVDENVSVEGGLSQITVGIDSKIVSPDQIPAYVSDYYFNDESRVSGFTEEQLGIFLQRARELNDFASVRAALFGLFYLRDNNQGVLPASLEALCTLPEAQPIFKDIISNLRSVYLTPRFASILIFCLGRTDLEWLRLRHSRLLYTHGAEIRFYLRERFFNLIREQNLGEASHVLQFFGAIFTFEDEEYKKLNVLFAKLEALKAQGAQSITLKDVAGIDPLLMRYVSPIFLDSLHSSAEKALRLGKSEDAIRSLLQIGFEGRTPRTHELVLEGIKNIPETSDIILRIPELHPFLKMLSVKDGAIKEQYASLLERLARKAFSLHATQSAQQYIQLLSEIRLDPSAFNDAVRIDGALLLYEKGDAKGAREVLSTVRMSIPLYKRVSLLWYKLNALYLLLLAAFLAFGLIFIGLLRGKKDRGKIPAERSKEEYRQTSKPFVTLKERDGGATREYIDCLRVLGLPPEASLASIKSSYRNKIKVIHPDSNVTQEISFTDELVKLKEVYDKALMLRTRLGLGDEAIED